MDCNDDVAYGAYNYWSLELVKAQSIRKVDG